MRLTLKSKPIRVNALEFQDQSSMNERKNEIASFQRSGETYMEAAEREKFGCETEVSQHRSASAIDRTFDAID